MPETITIQGAAFQVPDGVLARYDQYLTPEAPEGLRSTIHQTICENLRNNFAKKVKDALNGSDELPQDKLTELQGQFAEYAQGYEFGVRGSGPARIVDPVERTMNKLAKDDLTAKYKAKYGQKEKPGKEWLETMVPQYIDRYRDQLTKRARAIVRAGKDEAADFEV